MTTGPIGGMLEGAGFPATDIAAKAELFDQVETAAANLLQRRLDHAWWIPGRLEVFGTHTDYAGGQSLVCAVPRGFIVAGSRRMDTVVRVLDARRGDTVTLDLHAPHSALDGWRHYVDVVAARLARNFPEASLGADIAFASDLPRASGMSSSSALVTGVATALVELGGLRHRPEWQASIRDRLDEATYYSCLENGRGFGPLTGDAGVGTHGGSEDHAAMLCSTPGALTRFGFMPMVRLDIVPVPEGWQFVVCSSGVTAEKTGAARDQYNRLAASAAVLLALWRDSGHRAVSLGTVLDSRDALVQLRELIRWSPRADWPVATLSNRLEHFVRENTRVKEAPAAIRAGDIVRTGELASASQHDAERLLENQTAATVMLTRAAIDEGAFAARSFGAGFGGSVWALIARERAEAFAARWLERYRARFGGGANAATFLVTPAPPVVELSSSD